MQQRALVWALIVLTLAGVGLALALVLSIGSSRDAEAGGTTPELSLAGKDHDCDTNPNTGFRPPTCQVLNGTQFTVQGVLDNVPALTADTDGDTVAGYNAIQMRFQNSSGLAFSDRPGVAEAVDCAGGIPAQVDTNTSDHTVSCSVGPGQNGRTDTGTHFELDYTCTALGAHTITLPNGGPPDSHLTDENGAAHADGSELDTLTINCSARREFSLAPVPCCNLNVGEQFTVQGRLDSFSGLTADTDGDTIAGYTAIQMHIRNSPGLTFNDRPGVAEAVNCAGGITAQVDTAANDHTFSCSVGAGQNGRTDTGVHFELDFTCATAGFNFISFVQFTPDNHITDENGTVVASGPQNSAGITCHPTPELTLAGKNLSCDTLPSFGFDSSCEMRVGSPFTVEGRLDWVAGLTADADGDTIAGYDAIQMRFQNSPGLTFDDRPGVAEAVDCAGGIPAQVDTNANDHTLSCSTGAGQNGRTDTGVHFELDYTCATVGTHTMTLPNGGPPDSHIIDENGAALADSSGTDTLTIRCYTVEMSMTGRNLGCDTDAATPAPAKCTVSVGSQFNVDLSLDSFGGLMDSDGDMKPGWTSVQWHVLDSANLTFVPQAIGTIAKNCAGGIAAIAGGDGDFGATCVTGVGQNERTDTGNMLTARYTCSTVGTGALTMINGGGIDSQITDEAGVAHAEPNPTEILTINCIPPDGQIHIDKIDSFGGAFIGPSCWDLNIITAVPPPPPLSEPVFIKSPIGIVGDNGLVCPPSGLFQDENPNLGQIDITVPGGVLYAYPVVYVQERVPPPKYDPSPENLPCSFATSNVCQLTFENTRIAGNAHIRFNDAVTGGVVPGQCIYIDPPIYAYQADHACDNDGSFDKNPDLGELDLALPFDSSVYSLSIDPASLPANRQVVPPDKIICNLTQAAPDCELKFTYRAIIPFNLKTPTLQNLFLTAQGAKLPPSNCAASTDTAVFTHTISNAPTTPDPKDPTQVQRVGAFELSVLYDSDLVCVQVLPGQYALDTGMICFTGGGGIGCVTLGKNPPPSDSLELARIIVRPQPELYSLITADQDNGVVVQVLNSGCNLADMQGHPIKKIGCDDSELTVRWLEGDVNGDCAVDVRDQQVLAFRWGAKLGALLYNDRFDLEPSGQINSDGDVDIKDVQFVYGRHGSTCANPRPPQPPRNGKLTTP